MSSPSSKNQKKLSYVYTDAIPGQEITFKFVLEKHSMKGIVRGAAGCFPDIGTAYVVEIEKKDRIALDLMEGETCVIVFKNQFV